MVDRTRETSSGASGVSRTLVIVTILAVACGLAFRFANAHGKIYYQDEAVTSVRGAGYELADVYKLFDGNERTAGDLQRLMIPGPDRSVADTVHSLALEDPQHPPAFYALEAAWSRIAGAQPFAIRALSVILSAAGIPCVYLLAFELFRSRQVALETTALFAISPIFILYAYQAREYGMLTSVIALSSWLFLRAQRTQTPAAWAAYGFSAALGIYTYLLFAFVLVAHAISALETTLRTRKPPLGFVASAGAGVVLAVPWLLVFLHHRAVAADDVSWATSPYPLKLSLAKWGFHSAGTFFDLEYVRGQTTIVAAIVLLALAACVVGVVRGERRTNVSALIFVAALGGVSFLGLAIPDAILHHRFATIARYLLPTWLALVLAVGAATGARRLRPLSCATFALLACAAIFSDVASARSSTWWENNGNKAAPLLAAYVNHEQLPVLVSIRDYAPWLDAAPLMDARIRWYGYGAAAMPPSSALAKRALLLSPTSTLKSQLESDHLTLRLLYDSHDLSSQLAKFRAETVEPKLGANDWGEVVLYEANPAPAKRSRAAR